MHPARCPGFDERRHVWPLGTGVNRTHSSLEAISFSFNKLVTAHQLLFLRP